MGKLHHLGLLLWKNLTLRKRHYIVTACQIIAPIIIGLGLGVTYGLMVPDRDGMYYYGPDDHNPSTDPTIYPQVSENELLDNFAQAFTQSPRSKTYVVILYTPVNDNTTALIELMNATYLEAAKNLEYISCSTLSVENCTLGVWRGVDSEQEMETAAAEYFALSNNFNSETEYPNGRLMAGIIFTSDMTDIDTEKFSYKLRFTDGYFQTDSLADDFDGPGNTPIYEYGGFLGLQIMLDQAIIQVLSPENHTLEMKVDVQRSPYPPYTRERREDIEIFFNYLVPVSLFFAYLFVLVDILRVTVSEKETGVHELLALMGLSNWMTWVGQFVNTVIVLIPSVTLLMVFFYIPFQGHAGAAFKFTDPTLLWCLLALFSVAFISFVFFLSTFFSRPSIAISLGVIVYFVTYFAVIFPFAETMQDLSTIIKILMCLIPMNALHYATQIIGTVELQEIGGQWSRIDDGINAQDSFGLYIVMLMLVGDIVLYTILTLYLERVLPSPFGLRKPWYYIFLPSEWGIGKKKSPVENVGLLNSSQNSESFEKEPSNTKVGIEISNLYKEFNGAVAVAGMNLKIYEGQITALLGQNGAGKTTTMSILTGMYSPTSGTAYVNGYNIRTEMEKVRENLALCPQHNMLFNHLSVKENLVFFARLSGLSAKKANEEANELLIKLRLSEKMNALSASLSGGQKRKISLGCALITGAKVVILDEPTSGLDVENRRSIWDLLLEFRVDRTIVLTTHFMEEADVLGDRIAIMDQGQLVCAGTPMFLKNYYGTGYILNLTINPTNGVTEILNVQQQILKVVQSQFPEASISRYGSDSANTLAISIPSSSTSKFPALFADLGTKKAEFGIQTFGMAQTTMDDVFVRVGEINSVQPQHDIETNNSFEESKGGYTKKNSGMQLILQQLWILIKKRAIYAIRRPMIIVIQVVIPILLLIAAILITNSTLSPSSVDDPDPALVMTLDSYPGSITSLKAAPGGDAQAIANHYEELVGGTVTRVTGDMNEYYLAEAGKDLGVFRNQHIVGAEISDTNFKAWYSSVQRHAFPLSVNLAMTSLLQNITGNQRLSFEVTNHPFHDTTFTFISMNYNSIVPPIVFGVLVPIGLVLLSVFFIILPIEERQNSAKQLQLMTGLDSSIYWLSFFLFDFLLLIVIACLLTVCFPIFEDYNVFTSNGGVGILFVTFVAFAFQTIPFVYLLSLTVKSVPGGFAMATLILVLTSGALSMAVGGLVSLTKGGAMFLTWIARFFPGYALATALSTFTTISMHNVRCSTLTDEHKAALCIAPSNFFALQDLQDCCPQCGRDGFPPCFETEQYMTWQTNYSMFGIEDFPGITVDISFMWIVGLLYILLLLFIERGTVYMLRKMISRATEFYFEQKTKDEDVLDEHARVQQLVSKDDTNEDALVVNNFGKSFGTFSAVSHLSFGVHHGECFGLLGVNGAGKTTTFRILAGDVVPSEGNAYTNGNNLENDKSSFLKNLAYCPQFDGIVGVLTGNEMLEVFGSLRGIPRKAISQEVSKWMSKMGLSKSGKVECKKYSGGMKRRLSSAMAMIGEPKIVLLDEPTTGVDPVARREFWKVITSVKDSGQAVVLTSHSMEECEKLCTRLGIMVNGEFQCLGPVQHLKEKFAKGYSLKIMMKQMIVDININRMNELKNNILQAFSPCTIKDEHQTILEFHLDNTNLEWAYLFKHMESLRSEFNDILEDYALNQTTLEEVFLSFARQQYPERKAKVSRFKKLFSVFY